MVCTSPTCSGSPTYKDPVTITRVHLISHSRWTPGSNWLNVILVSQNVLLCSGFLGLRPSQIQLLFISSAHCPPQSWCLVKIQSSKFQSSKVHWNRLTRLYIEIVKRVYKWTIKTTFSGREERSVDQSGQRLYVPPQICNSHSSFRSGIKLVKCVGDLRVVRQYVVS